MHEVVDPSELLDSVVNALKNAYSYGVFQYQTPPGGWVDPTSPLGEMVSATSFMASVDIVDLKFFFVKVGTFSRFNIQLLFC